MEQGLVLSSITICRNWGSCYSSCSFFPSFKVSPLLPEGWPKIYTIPPAKWALFWGIRKDFTCAQKISILFLYRGMIFKLWKNWKWCMREGRLNPVLTLMQSPLFLCFYERLLFMYIESFILYYSTDAYGRLFCLL